MLRKQNKKKGSSYLRRREASQFPVCVSSYCNLMRRVIIGKCVIVSSSLPDTTHAGTTRFSVTPSPTAAAPAASSVRYTLRPATLPQSRAPAAAITGALSAPIGVGACSSHVRQPTRASDLTPGRSPIQTPLHPLIRSPAGPRKMSNVSTMTQS